MKTKTKKYLATQDVAEELGVTRMTVRNLIHRGELPALRVGKSFKIKPGHLRRYIAENSTSSELSARWDRDDD